MKPLALWAAILTVLVLSLGTPVYSATYSTSFPLTENPISESGVWITGNTVGRDWTDVRTKPGLAYGTQTGTSANRYNDSIAILTGNWGPDQTVEGTVYSINQTLNYYQEVELWLRGSITPHSITGYEINYRMTRSLNRGYVQITRWNGGYAQFTYISFTGPGAVGAKQGDVVKASIVGTTITVYLNGTLIATAHDSGIANGNPGMGFYLEGGAGTNADFGLLNFAASDGESVPPPPPPPTSATLTVTKAGAGTGTVTSGPSGIACGSTCSAAFASGTVVTLTAVPSAGAAFTGWSGAGCSGTGTCVVTLTNAASVGATFAAVSPPASSGEVFRLTVTKSGFGTVTSSPSGINCGTTCSATFPVGTTVRLTPSWSGLTFSVNAEIVP